ncbi:MAG: proline racemase family protein [Bacteroidota bacterium]
MVPQIDFNKLSSGEARKIRTVDMHTGGEPLRIVVEGCPEIKTSSLLEYRKILKERYDTLRTTIMHEPRGHADMYGCLILPPFHKDAFLSVIFMHNEGYSTMCGHGTIALASLAYQLGWTPKDNGVAIMNIEAPCGLIRTRTQNVDGNIMASFECVPSFVVGLDYTVKVEGYGNVQYDLAYGGAFYAYVNSKQVGLRLVKDNYRKIIDAGMAIKHAVMKANKSIVHPFESDLSFLYGTIFIDESVNGNVDSRNVCVFADGEVDRSPTGSGVSGRMAIHYKRGEISQHQKMSIESITGSVFTGEVVREEKYGPFTAVIPRVEGTAHVTGQHEFMINPDDPFADGFFLR